MSAARHLDPDSGHSPPQQVHYLGQALPYRMGRIERLAPRGWHRYALLAVARTNAGDPQGRDDALSVLFRMVIDDLGLSPEAALQLSTGPAPWIESINPKGWHRLVLCVVVRANTGDSMGRDDCLSMLLRMVADDLGGTPETLRAIERATDGMP